MTALDTNVLVRLVVRDHPGQAEQAAAAIRAEACFVSKTVLLETEWVLRAVFGYTREQTVEAFLRLESTTNVEFEDSVAASTATEWHRAGLDFADALHLASARSHGRFASFDVPLRKAARRLGVRPRVSEP